MWFSNKKFGLLNQNKKEKMHDKYADMHYSQKDKSDLKNFWL